VTRRERLACFLRTAPRLYGVLPAGPGATECPDDDLRAVLASGCRLVQLRLKEATGDELFRRALAWREIIPLDEAFFLVNDRADIAAMVGADGVHLGQQDLPPAVARRLLPADAVLGLSTHSLEQARRAQDEDLDYIAAGPIFATSTKPDAEIPIGLETLAAICAESRLPVVAIGGLTPENATAVTAAGASALAVLSTLRGQGDVRSRTRRLLDLIGDRT
jgi:thiamine-phosphate pyrophosphorylase